MTLKFIVTEINQMSKRNLCVTAEDPSAGIILLLSFTLSCSLSSSLITARISINTPTVTVARCVSFVAKRWLQLHVLDLVWEGVVKWEY